jgi:predicted enzyme related to lactoylglutathione lyase
VTCLPASARADVGGDVAGDDGAMSEIDLFAELAVTEYAAGMAWYERFLGRPASLEAHATESVWELAEHRYLVVLERPEAAGHGIVTVFLEDYEGWLAAVQERGIEPTTVETYDNGVRKATFHDPDGNEIGFGGAPLEGKSGDD